MNFVMISDGKPFDTNAFFVGGNGLFIQYHDVVKPVYLYAILKALSINDAFGLPLQIIKHMSSRSLLEWYYRRRFANPFQCLDYNHTVPKETLDTILQKILLSDPSIYKLAPTLNIQTMLDVYRRQHMSFPIFVYSKRREDIIAEDIKTDFPGITIKYLYGDLREAISKCDNNFTYIFSDIELLKESVEILIGTYSHILLSRDYRYNYTDHYQTTKYDLYELGLNHPFVRIGLTQSSQPDRLLEVLSNIIKVGGGNMSATSGSIETHSRG